MSQNGPRGRVRKVEGTAQGPERKEQVSTEGPVGKQDGYAERREQNAKPAPQSPVQGKPGISRPSVQTGAPRPIQSQQPPAQAARPAGSAQNSQPSSAARPGRSIFGSPQSAAQPAQNTQNAKPVTTGLGGTRPEQNARPAGSGFTASQSSQRPQNTAGSIPRPQNAAGIPQSSQQQPQNSSRPQAQPHSMNAQRPNAPKTSSTVVPPVSSKPSGTSASSGSGTGSQRTSRKAGLSPLLILVVVALLFFGKNLFGSNSSSPDTSSGLLNNAVQSLTSQTSSLTGDSGLLSGSGDLGSTAMSALAQYLSGSFSAAPAASSSSSSPLSSLASTLGGSWFTSTASTAPGAAGTVRTDSTRLSETVASGSREKYTAILGDGRDVFTIMVYMCATDLESKAGMATKDLQEMLSASFGDNINLIIYTGGCTGWKNQYVSNRVNQIWQVRGGKLTKLEDSVSTSSMTNPSTLSSFIQYCRKNFPASRYGLILWDHGSGTVSGYGYDQRNPSSGSMSLAGINQALNDGKVKFDFVGFDACLMATVETGLMLSQHSDYMIASEETEPGVGWYYTDWLSALGKNTSMPTTQLGKQICDDFVSACATSARGQSTTLSLVDLAELSNTVPAALTGFSKSVSSLVSNKEYKTVSDARNLSREFATSTKIDQVDLIDLCTRMNTTESNALASALKGAIKYNRSGSMTNAYGLSAYFPYRSLSKVDKAISTYRQLGMDETYSEAIRDFASVEFSGQHATSYPSNPLESIFSAASAQPAQSSSSQDMISDLLGAFLGGGSSSSMSGFDFFSGRSLSNDALTSYVQANHLDPSRLVFAKSESGEQMLTLEPEEWAQITGAEQNVFYDDGSGYLDLGLDNVYSFDAEGRMIAAADGAWVTVNGQFVAYYHESSEDDGEKWADHGRIPVLFNGENANLLVTFDEEHPSGAITGVRFEYTDETETVAKSVIDLEEGDLIQFLCDYYTYDKEYQASHVIGDPLTWSADVKMSASYIEDPSKVLLTYMFTDIYQNEYWTGPLSIQR